MPDPGDPPADVPSVEADSLTAFLRSVDGVTVLDVRNRDEYEQWRLTGDGVETVQVPYYQVLAAKANDGLPALFDDLGIDVETPVLAVCGRGDASANVAFHLNDAGFDARNLAGGMDAWARVYESVEVTRTGLDDGTVLQYHRPATGCVAYLVLSDGEAAAVDPLRAFADRYAADVSARGADLTYVLDTHLHADHLSGVRRVVRETGATPVVPAGTVDRGLEYEVSSIADGGTLDVGALELEAVSLPGHTSDSTGYRVGDVLLTGDTLFLHSVGRPDLESGAAGVESLARSLYETLTDRIGAMDASTVVAPGHVAELPVPSDEGSYTARLGRLRERLDALSMDESTFVEYVGSNLPDRPANYERIVAVNRGLVSVDDDEAADIELGPNNCAVSPT
jgi:glyoxylase-like metal-dependent hydrolase (beta-lactamase superfamily II)